LSEIKYAKSVSKVEKNVAIYIEKCKELDARASLIIYFGEMRNENFSEHIISIDDEKKELFSKLMSEEKKLLNLRNL